MQRRESRICCAIHTEHVVVAAPHHADNCLHQSRTGCENANHNAHSGKCTVAQRAIRQNLDVHGAGQDERERRARHRTCDAEHVAKVQT